MWLLAFQVVYVKKKPGLTAVEMASTLAATKLAIEFINHFYIRVCVPRIFQVEKCLHFVIDAHVVTRFLSSRSSQ